MSSYGRQLQELVNCYIAFHMKTKFNDMFLHCQILIVESTFWCVAAVFVFAFMFPQTIYLKNLEHFELFERCDKPVRMFLLRLSFCISLKKALVSWQITERSLNLVFCWEILMMFEQVQLDQLQICSFGISAT